MIKDSMVFAVGLAFMVCWLLIAVFAVPLNKSILATAIIFLILGLVDYTLNGHTR